MMRFGVQRRSIYVVPPGEGDVAWIAGQFDDPQIYLSLGLTSPSGQEITRRFAANDHVFGVIREASTRTRIGFVVMFPPSAWFDAWSFCYAIPNPECRNAFNALHTTDAMAYYMFDHLQVDAVGWETSEDNRPADAVVRRLGYACAETRTISGRSFKLYLIDGSDWAKRKARAGGTFAKLEAPFVPVSL
jgi:hypothetical protein